MPAFEARPLAADHANVGLAAIPALYFFGLDEVFTLRAVCDPGGLSPFGGAPAAGGGGFLARKERGAHRGQDDKQRQP